MKKVLFVLNIPSPYRVKFLNELAKSVDLFVIFERKYAIDRNNDWFNQQITFKYVYLKSFKYGKDKSMSLNFFKYIRDKYDHVFVGGYSSFTLVLIIFTLKILKRFFSIEFDGGIYRKQFFLLYYFKCFLFKLPSFIFSSSDDCDSFLYKYKVNKNKIIRYRFSTLYESELNYNQIYSKNFKPNNLLLLPKNKYRFLSVINNHYIKGLDILIYFLNNTNINFEIDIVNISKTNPLLLNMSVKTKLNTNIHEFIPNDKLKDFFSNADFFIFPTRGDVWGIVVYEALSFGTPVISTNKSLAALKFINSSNGFIINSLDPDEFKNQIEYYLSRFKALNLGNCYDSIINNTIENMVKDHLDII